MAFDAIISGGGPAGLSCAALLAEAGLSVCVAERKPKTGYPVCCGEAISKQSLISSGFFDESYISAKVKGYRIFFPDNNYMSVESPGYILERGKFEQHLALKAAEAGAKIMLNEQVLSCSQDDSSVSVTTKSGIIKGRFLVAADGPESLMARTFFSEENKLINAMQYRIKKPSNIKSCNDWLDFYYDTLSPYYFWNFEKSGNFNTGGSCPDKGILADFMEKRLKPGAYDTLDFTRGKIPVGGLKEKLVNKRVILIGDAAGAVNPVSFAGIYGALLSAQLCCKAVIKALKNNNALGLHEYEKQMQKTNLAAAHTKYLARHCYNFSQETLEFLGAYFTGRSYRTKDVPRFLKLITKHPKVLKDLPALIVHRFTLRAETDRMW